MVQEVTDLSRIENIVIMPDRRSKPLYLRNLGKKGLGVFCSEDIKKDEIFETCPILYVPQEQVPLIDKTTLMDYYYYWNDGTGEHAAICLGYGSLYNHSYTPNAIYCKDYTRRIIEMKAIKDIPANTEITFNYNGRPDCMDPVWFGQVLE